MFHHNCTNFVLRHAIYRARVYIADYAMRNRLAERICILRPRCGFVNADSETTYERERFLGLVGYSVPPDVLLDRQRYRLSRV